MNVRIGIVGALVLQSVAAGGGPTFTISSLNGDVEIRKTR